MYQIKSLLLRAFDIFLKEGAGVLLRRLYLRILRTLGQNYQGNFDYGYTQWRQKFSASYSQNEAQELLAGLKHHPTFSIIVPVYNVETQWLTAAIESVKSQHYPHWQLCLIDDASTLEGVGDCLSRQQKSDSRISVAHNQKNLGIAGASDQGLALASAEYIAFMDHDDLLHPDALLDNARLINEFPDADLIYSDEDKIDLSGNYHSPFFKPGFSPELLESQNYIGHFVVIRQSLLQQLGGFRSGVDGAQDYDLLLRATARTQRIKHIAKVLYHWREVPGSTAHTFSAKSYAWEAGKRALQNHYENDDTKHSIELGTHPGTYRTRFKFVQQPKISIILPFKDQATLLDKCLQSLFDLAQWDNLEVLGINNNSQQPDTKSLINEWQAKEPRFRVVDYDDEFNYAAICNFGVQQVDGEYVLLLNSDIQFKDPGWVSELLGYACQDDIGAVGAKLLYPDQSIQHAGIVIGIDEGAGHPFKHFPNDHKGYFMRLGLSHNVSAVTGALLMVSRKKYLEVQGLDEEQFAIAYNDVDFCLKLLDAGYRNVVTPFCCATHHESSTRGVDLEKHKLQRHNREKQSLKTKWAALFKNGDLYYNPNLTLVREDYSLNQIRHLERT